MSDAATAAKGSGTDVGRELWELAGKLWPLRRSLTGPGIRETLRVLQQHLPELRLHEVPSGTACFDWRVPDEWTVRGAYLLGPDGERVIDFQDNNLHLVGYSEPVDKELSLEELRPHLFSLPDQPDAIPYITSYYRRFWGFCLPHRRLATLRPGKYRAVVDSDLKPGSMAYADLVLPGEEADREILLSTYACHPSMANNELSGPLVTLALARWLKSLKARRYTYRVVIGPETIGAICYLSRNLDRLKAAVQAGWVLTCVGDERCYSFIPSRQGDSLADRVSLHVLKHRAPGFKRYSFLDRGSDERQYCSPGVDLPVASITRSKYGEYPEYHTSLDDLSLVTPTGLQGSFEAYRDCLELLERNYRYQLVQPCEPQLGKRGLYPTISDKSTGAVVKEMMDFLAYCDGSHDLLSIGELTGVCALRYLPLAERLCQAGVIVRA